jgi:hypothetical protein
MFDFPQSNPKGKTGLAGLGRIATLDRKKNFELNVSHIQTDGTNCL